jgi:hypothetical protein
MSSEKIFGVGFSKTGTTSLEKALEILGYKVCRGHWKLSHTFYLHALYIHKDYDEIFRLINYWDAFADAPWGGTDLYLQLYNKFPNAKYILTVREPKSWYESLEKLITMFDLNQETALDSYHANGMYGSAYFFRHIFNIEKLAGNKQKIIDHFTIHNEKVIDFFSNHPANFMVYDITSGEKWKKLCKFLGVTAPKNDFPYANKAIDNPYMSNIVSKMQNPQSSRNKMLLKFLNKILNIS